MVGRCTLFGRELLLTSNNVSVSEASLRRVLRVADSEGSMRMSETEKRVEVRRLERAFAIVRRRKNIGKDINEYFKPNKWNHRQEGHVCIQSCPWLGRGKGTRKRGF